MDLRISALSVALLVAAAPVVASAAEVEPPQVHVQLWNKDNGTMGITLDKKSVPAGPVEFVITNTSKGLMHEALIAPWSKAPTALPYDASTASVKEDAVPGLEGSEDMKPGAEATVRLILKPGSYIIFCNQPGHYKMGMYTQFKVATTTASAKQGSKG